MMSFYIKIFIMKLYLQKIYVQKCIEILNVNKNINKYLYIQNFIKYKRNFNFLSFYLKIHFLFIMQYYNIIIYNSIL